MSKLNKNQFQQKYPSVKPHLLNTSLWNDVFRCPCCGQDHFFEENSVEILGDIPFNKMVVVCPNNKGVLVLHPKTFLGFGFKGFEILDWCPMEEFEK